MQGIYKQNSPQNKHFKKDRFLLAHIRTPLEEGNLPGMME